MGALEKRLIPLRGRLAVSRAVEDVQRGLPFGAAAAAATAILHHVGAVTFSPAEAASLGVAATLTYPVVALITRRVSAERLASTLDERLGLEERVSTALAAERGLLVPSPLHGLLEEDALRSLDAVPAPVLRRAFRSRLHAVPLVAGFLGLVLASAALIPSPLLVSVQAAAKESLSPREAAEREEAARQARLVRETARRVAEEAAALRQETLLEAAREMVRRAELQLQKRPPMATSLAGFHRMGEEARRALEQMAGTTQERMEQLAAAGELSKADLQLQRLLASLLDADLGSLGEGLSNLEKAMAGEGAPPSMEELEALQQAVEALAKALAESGETLEGREALKAALGSFGDPELMRELAERMAMLMETLQEQGYDPAAHGSPTPQQMAEAMRKWKEQSGAAGGGDAPKPPTPEQIQAAIDRLKEMQRLAELGRLAFCQGCKQKQGSGGT